MPSICIGSLSVCMAQVYLLTSAGEPDPGSNNLYVTDSIVSLGINLEVAEGTKHEPKNGCGDICYTYDEDDKVTGTTLDMVFCKTDPELDVLLLGGDTVADGFGVTIGYSAPPVAGSTQPKVAVEVWTKNIQGTDVDDDYPFIRWGTGGSTWRPNNRALANGPIPNPFAGKGREAADYGDGADGFWVVPTDRLWFYQGDPGPLPDSMCGSQELVAS